VRPRPGRRGGQRGRAGGVRRPEHRETRILTPAASGTAPAGLESTGDPVFWSVWTLSGLPALSVPLMTGANGLPLGVQLVGAPDGDARLLRTARRLVERVRGG
ncbi:MAG TPA: hypothetical protein VNN07_15930, partial [Candidatus Tectomicrobia bacterium]|nr:hypothetical protein [Candidatus Tectomicrobia bacterium]